MSLDTAPLLSEVDATPVMRAGVTAPVRIVGDDVSLILLEDVDAAFVIETGDIDVYLVEIDEGVPFGTRHHIASFRDGDLLLGIDGGTYMTQVGMIAVCSPEAVLWRIPVCDLKTWLTHAPDRFDLAGMVSRWVNAISDAGSRHLKPWPTIDVLYGPRDTGSELASGRRVSVSRGIGWMTATSGEVSFLDFEIVQPGEYIPVCTSSWLLVDRTAEIVCERTAALLADGRIWNALRTLHASLLETLPLILRLAAVDEANRLHARIRANETAQARGLAALAATASVKTMEPHDSAAADPLFAACRAVAARQGVKLAPPGQTATDKPLVLDAILDFNRIRKRPVTLHHRWWTQDIGSFLLLRDDGGPLAVLRRQSRYEVFDPENGSTTALSSGSAAQLRGTAYLLYSALSDEPLTPLKIMTHGLKRNLHDLGTIIGFGVLGGLIAVAIPSASAYLFDTVIPTADMPALAEVSLVLMTTATIQFFLQVVVGRSMLRLIGISGARLQTAVIDRILRLPVGFFRDFTAGDLLTRALAIYTVAHQLTNAMIGVLVSSFFTLASVAVMLFYAPMLGGIALVLIVIMSLVVFLLGIKRASYERDAVRTRGVLSHILYEMSCGVAKIRLAAAEQRVFGRWAIEQAVQAFGINRAARVARTSSILENAFPIAAEGAILTVIIAGGLMQSGLGVGTLAAFLSAFNQASAGIMGITKSLQDIMALGPTLDHAKPILSTVPESPASRADPGEISGEIEISHVNFRYTPTGPVILKDLSLQVGAGEFVALVGPSGCGKSTLLRLLLAFETPDSGAILLDGRNLRELDVAAVRRQFGVVLQDAQLFPGSILDNILGAHLHLPEAAAWRAAESAGLAEDIARFPMGMRTICGGTAALSGGQIQRVMIARAIVNRPRVLLFDEATSALDNRTQAIVLDHLSRFHATRIVIAHRLTTVIAADRIIVMNDGRIVDTGTFQELIDRDGLFRDLAIRQSH